MYLFSNEDEDIFFDLILKTSKKGIISAIILGFARAVGDTMIALMIAGNSLQIPNSILDSARILKDSISYLKDSISKLNQKPISKSTDPQNADSSKEKKTSFT